MATNVDIKKTKKDNAMGMLRKFTRKMRNSGVLRKKRSLRYFERSKSDFQKKEDKLTRIDKQNEYERLEKLGLVQDRRRRRR